MSRAEDATIQQTMPVADRSSPERIKASIRGFFEVLSALPGEPLDNQTRRELAGEADSYLQGYRYTAENEALYLQLFFDRNAVLERVKRERDAMHGGMPVVVSGQPVLLWLAVTQGSLEALLTEGSQGLLPNTLADVSLAQGQPVVLPADDALARGEVQLAQLRRGEVEAILRASAKYGMNRVLMGSLSLVDGDQWSATWQIPGAGRQWRSAPGTLDTVLHQGVLGYKQLTSAAPASAERRFGLGDDQVAVSVGGVADMNDFIWINQRLAALLGEDKVRPVVVGRDSVLFAVSANRDVNSVQRQLQTVNRLSAIPQQFNSAESTQSADLSYMLH
ncbi:MAG: DUF2066 domain-containing protein [Granulosicoccaceae bacterium]